MPQIGLKKDLNLFKKRNSDFSFVSYFITYDADSIVKKLESLIYVRYPDSLP